MFVCWFNNARNSNDVKKRRKDLTQHCPRVDGRPKSRAQGEGFTLARSVKSSKLATAEKVGSRGTGAALWEHVVGVCASENVKVLLSISDH